MGGITAPVLGSGACPAWIALVPSPHAAVSTASRGSVMSLNPLNSGPGILPSGRRPPGPYWARPRNQLSRPIRVITPTNRAPPSPIPPCPQPKTGRAPPLLDPPSQPVQQVDPGDQPQEPLTVEHDRHLPAIENRQQRLHRRLDVEDVELAHHGGRDRVAEAVFVAVDVQQHV